MQVYKTFFKILNKYKMSMLIYAVIMIGVLLMFVKLTDEPQKQDVKTSSYSIYVVNEDDSVISDALYNFLNENHKIKGGSYSEEEINDLLYYHTIEDYIVIPRGFGDDFVNNNVNTIKVKYDKALPDGLLIDMQIEDYLNSISNYTTFGYSLEEAIDKTEQSFDISKYVSIQSNKHENDRIYSGFNYLPFGIFSIIFAGVLPVILNFNEEDKKKRMIVSSTSIVKRNIFLSLATLTVALGVTGVLILMLTSFNVPFSKEWIPSILNAGIYTFVVVGFLIMIAGVLKITAKKDITQISGFITNIFGLSFAFLGGTFVGLDVMGDAVKKIGQFTPNYWYSIATKKIWFSGAGLKDIALYLVIELIMGIAFICIGLAASKVVAEKDL